MRQRDLMLVFNEFADNYIERLEESSDYKVVDRKRFKATLASKLFTDNNILKVIDDLFWDEIFFGLNESGYDWWGVEYREEEGGD